MSTPEHPVSTHEFAVSTREYGVSTPWALAGCGVQEAILDVDRSRTAGGAVLALTGILTCAHVAGVPNSSDSRGR